MQRHPEGLGNLRKGIPPLLAQTPILEPKTRVWGRSGYDFQSAVAASAQIPQASPAQATTAPTGVPIVSPGGTQGPTTSGNAVLDAVLLGVQQLQTLQAQQLTNPKKADAPETVKTGMTAFPKLAPPDPAGGSLELQDWMQLIAGLMSDFSDSSQLWWSGVVQVSKDAYDKWVVASPIERLTVEPDERPELTEGKWGRVNARACAMLLDALDPTVKSDIIARKANQAASQILFRLYTTYQPGGTGERNLVLSNLQNPHVVQDAVAGVSALRAWGRWYQRCIDFGMSLPDPMVLVGGLTSMTKPVISKEPEVSWRTEMVKSALQLHGRPSEEAVKSYHKHLLAEFETLAGAQVAKKGGSSNLALKAADASGDKGGKASGAKGGGKGGGNGATCKYFLSPKGCKFGSKCKYPHSMNELSKAERFKKCLNCGSEEHRAKDCKAGRAEPKTQDQKPSVQAASTSTPTSQSVVHATPVLSMETFMQQAVQALRQLEANPPRNDATPQSQPPQPEGVSTASQPSSTPNPSVKRLTIRSVMPSSCFPVSSSSPANEPPVEPSPVASQPPLIGYALLDSGATHPMRQASSEEEWIEADEVQVSLAGDQTTVMRLTRAGTLLLRPGRDGLVQPIVPMGTIIEQLGYKLVWSAGICKLYPPDGKSLRFRVKNGCPELVESQALTLISRLEEHKMQQVEELRRRTEEGKDRIRQAKIAMERTWWDHLVEHVSSSAPAAGHMAVSTAPFFHDVPDRALSGILPSDDVDSKKGDLEDRWVEGKYMGLSPSVNDGHIVLRSDGVGNGFVQTLHLRTRLVSPDPPPLQFVGDSLEEEHSAPPRRVRGKRSSGERPDHVVAPLPQPAESPHPEGFVSPGEEESVRVARLSLQDLEVFAKELIEDDWDLDGAWWVLAEVCRAAPELQHKAGLYRHGGRVGVLGSTADKPWLTELMIRVLSAVAPTAEYTSLWLSNSTAQPVHTDHHNLQGSTNVVLPLKLPPNGGDLWIELKSGDLVSGSVEERVDGKGRRWLGTTHKLERGQPFFLDPTRRHATTP